MVRQVLPPLALVFVEEGLVHHPALARYPEWQDEGYEDGKPDR